MARKVFLDTSYIVAIENADDPHHALALARDEELLADNALLVIHWGILLEIGDGYGRLQRRAKGIDLLSRLLGDPGYLNLPLTNEILVDALQLYRQRQDKEWGLTDCVSFVLMEREGITEALTADRHFVQAGYRALLIEP